jgi:tetratricopeptide (TPR) repeat protein
MQRLWCVFVAVLLAVGPLAGERVASAQAPSPTPPTPAAAPAPSPAPAPPAPAAPPAPSRAPAPATPPATATAATTAGEACIEDAAKANLAACPNNGPQTFDVQGHGNAPTVNFHSAPPPSDLKKRDLQTKPNVPTEQMDSAQRDDRKNRLQARQRALLVTEISGLENLFSGTPANAPDRSQVVRRLAEDYVELESAAFRDKTLAEIKRDQLKKTDPAGASQQQAQVQLGAQIMGKARENAEKFYTIIDTDYPDYPQLDEVLYYLAYEYEQANDNANARRIYYELIQKRPNSKYIPNAYLAFGELFFNDAQGDPSKWAFARDAYVKVIGYPPPGNKIYGYAWYKLAYVFWNTGELEKALNSFKKVIEYGTTYSDLPNASKLADSARKDLIPVYALKGDPAAAYNFFHGLSGDAPSANTRTFKMMDDLGNDYLDTGHYPEAIALYKDLIVRDRSGEKSCVYQAHITEATMAMKSGNKDLIKNELDNQAKVFASFKEGGASADAKEECANKTAALLTETAMAWHLEAVGSGGQRGTGDPTAMRLAAYLYKKVVDTWSAQQFAQFQFPRIVKEDWPNIYKIKYAMADLLYVQKDWAGCGPAFDSVVAENPNAPEAAEAAYASVLCYQNIYDQTHANGSDRQGSGNMPGAKKTTTEDETAKLKPKEFTPDQKGMIQAFNRYICYIHPGPNDAAGQAQLAEVKYARARTYFEAQHWQEASIAFREIAMASADKDIGIYAAQLYLESVNVLGSHSSPPRPSCFDDMATDVPKFIDLYCSADKVAKNQDQCTTLTKIQCDVQRLKAQKLTEIADKGAPNAAQLDEQAGNIYFEIWHKYGEAQVVANQPVLCERLDEVVYNGAKAYQAGRLIAKAIAARMVLLNPDYKMDKSDLARKAIYEIGGNYQAIAVYDQAALWYEKYADLKPLPEKAEQALSDAVLLRLGLGQEAEAITDSETFRRKFGAKKSTETAAIQFAIGAHYAEKEEWTMARLALQGSMYIINLAPPDIQVQAHATLARSFVHLKDGYKDAQSEYGTVRKLWKDPAAAVAKINDAYKSEDEGQRAKRLAKSLNAVGEAYFFAAEEARRLTVEPITFPEYKGAGNKVDVLRHINTRVAAWYKKKMEAIEKVEPEYVKILDIQPVKPPRWVIAAGSRAGLMWGNFVDEFRAAPIPKEWKHDAELRGAYYDALDAASEPFKTRHAKPALEKCLKLSVEQQYFDEFSRACEVWLAKNYKAEYHVVDELRGAPTLSNSAVEDRPALLLRNGTPSKGP